MHLSERIWDPNVKIEQMILDSIAILDAVEYDECSETVFESNKCCWSSTTKVTFSNNDAFVTDKFDQFVGESCW